VRRLNVRFSQVEECIRTSLFAVDSLPQSPPLQRGEVMLLQLTKDDAEEQNKLKSRIEFALIFDHYERDPDGVISRAHWRKAGKTWKYILYGSETIPTAPFSLELLGLDQSYAGIGNPVTIRPADEVKILPYLTMTAGARFLPSLVNVHDLLRTIKNYDQVVHLAPVRTSLVSEHERRLRNPWLGNALKVLYDHRCQVCTHDFKPRYDVPYADTRLLTPVAEGGEPVSRNVVVLCPNHNAIVGAARATFDVGTLSFSFPNGLTERLLLRDHLV
jgi:hypothetical protein